MTNINNINQNISSSKDVSLVEKYKFSNQYFVSPEKLKDEIIKKTIIPHQVEFQPGSQSKKICWLSCRPILSSNL